MKKTIAQLKITGITDSSVDYLEREFALQKFEEIKLFINERLGTTIVFEIEDIQLIEAEEL